MAEISAVAGFEQPEELRAESIEDLEAGDTGEVSSVGALPKAESTEMDQPTPLDPQDDAVPSSFNTFRLRVPAEEVTPKPRGGKGRSIVPRMLLARSKTSIAHEPQTLRQVGRSVSSVGTSGTFFQEARPVVGTTHFPAPPASTQTAVAVCLYNEVGPALARTIDPLAAPGRPACPAAAARRRRVASPAGRWSATRRRRASPSSTRCQARASPRRRPPSARSSRLPTGSCARRWWSWWISNSNKFFSCSR